MSFMELTPIYESKNPFVNVRSECDGRTHGNEFHYDVNMITSTPQNPFTSQPTGDEFLYNANLMTSTPKNPFTSQNPFTRDPTTNQTTSESIDTKRPKQIKKPIKLPDNFNGNTSLRDYLRHFDRCAVVNEWNSEESALFLSAALQGEAQKILHGMSDDDCKNYQKLVARLEARYGVETQKELHQARLTNRRQKDGESLKCLATEIRDLCSLAYQDLPPEAQERFCVQHFIDAINDRDDRMKLRRDKPRNLDVALSSACELEAFRQLDNSLHQREPAMQIRSGKILSSDTNNMAVPQEAQQQLSGRLGELKLTQEAQQQLSSMLEELKSTQEAQKQLSRRLDELKLTQEAQLNCIHQLSNQMQKWFKTDNQGNKPEQQPTKTQQLEC